MIFLLHYDALFQMALQAALNKSQPQGNPLTPRAQYADGSDHGNSLHRPGTAVRKQGVPCTCCSSCFLPSPSSSRCFS